MKRNLLILFLSACFAFSASAQCVTTCSNYVAVPITYSLFPTAGTDAIPLFSPTLDDGYTPPIQIGFNFDFYCTSYNSVLIYSNGLIQFNIGVPSTFPLGYDAAQLIPNPSVPTVLNGIVAFKMDDFDPGVSGAITYTTIGTAPNRMFIVTYSAVPVYTATPPTNLLNSGQIVLHETSNYIDIYTIDAPLSANLVTQGIENATGTLATASPGRNQGFWSGSNDGYRFIPVTPAVPTGIMGATSICSGIQSTYSITTQTGALSYSWTVPQAWSGTSTTTAVTATTGTSGSLSVTATYTCGTSAATTIVVNTIPAPVITIASVDPPIICSGNQFTLTPSGGINYTLNPGGITSNSVFIVTATTFTNYILSGSDANCTGANTSTNIIVNETPTLTVNSGSICQGAQFTITPTSTNSDSYFVSGGFSIVQPTAGIYSYVVIGTSSTSGCSSIPAVSNLTVNANPVLTLTSPKSTICKEDAIVLTAGGAATYSWNTGAVTKTVSVVPGQTKSYTVTGTTAEGCNANKTINIVVFICTGLNSVENELSGVSVFPNPSKGLVSVNFNNTLTNATIELSDLSGRVIMRTNVSGADNVIDLREQANGLYYVKVTNAEMQQTFKIIKE